MLQKHGEALQGKNKPINTAHGTTANSHLCPKPSPDWNDGVVEERNGVMEYVKVSPDTS
jgi:hypothetical protein